MSIEEPPQGSAEEGAHATLRAAWLVSGVREALPLDDGLPAHVLPLPDLRDGRQVPQLLEQALTRIGFVTKIDVPVWMAGTARDLSLVIAGAQTGPMPETAAMLEATLRRALDVAALTMGATPVMVGGVVEVLEGETWRPLALEHPPRPPLGRPLERRAAEGEVVARLHPGATWAALDVDPRLRIWTALYAKAAAETDLDLLVLGHMALLETVASGLADKAVAPAGETLLLADGTPAEVKNLQVRVYGLVRWALAVLGSPDTILLARNASPLWEDTLRPPSVTEPSSAPWRLAVRAGSWRPLGPASSVTSASISSAITSSPTAVEAASSPSRTCSAKVAKCPSIRPASWSGSWRSTVGANARRAGWSWLRSADAGVCEPAMRGSSLRLGGLPEPAAWPAPGGGPPPQIPRTPGQPSVIQGTAAAAGQAYYSSVDRRQGTIAAVNAVNPL